ncbi:MAG: transposase [Planctomycetota bacterium]|nr:MAG: transposase [Planctomycetota bacterium]REK18066.1 MAG: transposase [Planctomycetota bacterium]REK40218.1 MAG: transposase [Planctomycetota bacterium]
MKTEEFVAQVRQSVVEENTGIYRDLFENTTSATDPYWIRALGLYKALDDEQKEVLFEIVRQVTVDSVSNVFAIVDGVTELDGQDGSVRLQCGPDELSGELQDRFLEQFED